MEEVSGWVWGERQRELARGIDALTVQRLAEVDVAARERFCDSLVSAITGMSENVRTGISGDGDWPVFPLLCPNSATCLHANIAMCRHSL